MLLNKRFVTRNPVNWIDFKFRMEFTTPQTDTTSKTTRQHDPKRENTNIVARAERRRRGEKALSTWALCASRRCSNDCCCCRLVRNQGILSKIRSSPRSFNRFYRIPSIASNEKVSTETSVRRQNQNSWALYGCFNAGKRRSASPSHWAIFYF